MSLDILILEPYYGGSHKSFVRGLKKLPFEFTVMTLPARKWKWRMRLSAPYFAQKLYAEKKRYDLIICSSYVDVAAFRGIAPPWVRDVSLLTYFHENQFAYPVRKDDERDFHFALTNVTTALASDSSAFNSSFNLASFMYGMENLLDLSYDLKLNDPVRAIKERSRILPPGLDYTHIDQAYGNKSNPVPVVLWNHRWEHDKNPEQFFEALYKFNASGIEFKLIVLGESFKNRPYIFDEARERLSHRVIYFGYATSPHEYASLLAKSDIVVSTAHHEFFGISVIEAVRAGCRPLLPKRLSYPELFPEEYLYDDENFLNTFEDLLVQRKSLTQPQARMLTERFSWDSLSEAYILWIASA